MDKKISEKEARDIFDDMLNEVYGAIDVCGYKYDASFALKFLDETAYNCYLSDWLDSQEMEMFNE